jgi:hypothetical protein
MGRNLYKISAGKQENRPLGRPTFRLGDNIKTDLGEITY